MKKRPTSPHLTIYKWQITSITSILHRLTGVMLFGMIIFFCLALGFVAENTNLHQDGFEILAGKMQFLMCDCIIIKSLLYLVTFGAMFGIIYHLCNGMRYLFWSFAVGMGIKTASNTGYLVLFSAIILSLLAVYGIYC